jgi:hypothetical protein
VIQKKERKAYVKSSAKDSVASGAASPSLKDAKSVLASSQKPTKTPKAAKTPVQQNLSSDKLLPVSKQQSPKPKELAASHSELISA